MRPEGIRMLLRRQPFRPLRITLTDGRTYDVLHPELALLGRSYMEVGLPKQEDPDNIADRLITISLLHIMQIEPLESVTPPPGR
jgi:hypothetical protein